MDLMNIWRTPTFPRFLRLGLEESKVVLRAAEMSSPGDRVMIDVGAHRGSSTLPFAERGWRVYAFEPDQRNRRHFERVLDGYENVTIDPRAVTDVDGAKSMLYESDESTGISSLLAFADSHRPSTKVETVRLDTFLAVNSVDRVDFLKVDTEGYDLLVLRSFPWQNYQPPFVLCEFEDRKTRHLGYSTQDIIHFLRDRGYHVLISEWHPIVRYGVTHAFFQLRVYDGRGPKSSSWGNLLALKQAESIPQMFLHAVELLDVRMEDAWGGGLARRGFEIWRSKTRLRIRTSSAL